jgi:hypothetical protein
MEQNKITNGKEELVDFDFIGGRLLDMHQQKTSLSTTQMELTHEA